MKNQFYYILIIMILFSIVESNSIDAQDLRISGGYNYSASVCDNQKVSVWGSNTGRQLGIDNLGNPIVPSFTNSPTLVEYGNIDNTVAGYNLGLLPSLKLVDAGSGGHVTALSCANQVWQWGNNDRGQLGRNNNTIDATNATPTRVFRGAQTANVNASDPNGIFLNNIQFISGGNNTSLAVEIGTGRVLAWGENDFGQLGDGSTTNRFTPVYVYKRVTSNGPPSLLDDIVQIEGGDNCTYALDRLGRVWSWGQNVAYNLGRSLGVASDAFYAMQVDRSVPNCNQYGCSLDGKLTGIKMISGGDTHCLALDSSGSVWSFGGDWGRGQLGKGGGDVYVNYASRVVIPGRTAYGTQDDHFIGGIGAPVKATFVAAGQASSAVVLDNGKVVTFGIRGLSDCNSVPVQSGTIGCPGTCGVIGGGTLGDANAQCGLTTCPSTNPTPPAATYSVTPVYVKTDAAGITDLQNIVSVSDGDAWYFAFTSSGTVFTWGFNRRGELGLGDYNDRCYAVPFTLPTGCSFTHPCPGSPTLPADFTSCPIFSATLNSQVPKTYGTYVHNWKYSSTSKLGPYTSIPGSDVVSYSLNNQLGYYIVEVSDSRASVPSLCGPCPVLRDTIAILESANPYTSSACEETPNSVANFEIVSPTNAKIKWYTNPTGGVALNPSDSNRIISAISFAQTNTAAGCPGGSRALFAEDVSSVLGALRPATTIASLETILAANSSGVCNQGSWSSTFDNGTDPRYPYMIEITRTVTISAASIVKGNNNTGDYAIRIFSNNPTGGPNCGSCTPTGNKDGEGTLLYTSPTITSSAATNTILEIPMSYTLTPGFYWIAAYGTQAIQHFNCNKTLTTTINQRWTNRDLDNTGQNIISGVLARSDDPYSGRGTIFNIKFSAGTGYTCGRIRVCVSSTCVILPVNFIDFNLKVSNSGNPLVLWSVSRDAETKEFVVYRSIDGINFFPITTIGANNNGGAIQNYSYEDTTWVSSVDVYYKIKGVDFSGEVMYTEIKSLRINNAKFIITPNPSSGLFYIKKYESNLNSYEVLLLNTLGQTVRVFNWGNSLSQFEIDLSSFSSGVYYLVIKGKDSINQFRILKEGN